MNAMGIIPAGIISVLCYLVHKLTRLTKRLGGLREQFHDKEEDSVAMVV